jgi:FkbM family methyltransferase
MSLKERLYRRAVHVIASRRNSSVARAVAHGCRSYLNCYENVWYEPELNGELRVLSIVADDHATCVFDVGANVGEWTRAAVERAPSAAIHSFEIVPDTAAQLAARFAAVPQVTINPFGLSDTADTIAVKYFPDFSEASGATGFDHDGMRHEMRQCEVRAGDDYCADHGIDGIDFLKIDTEGLDLRVLQGFDAMLAGGRVKAVQFEYGLANIAAHALLFDFVALLEGYGYRVGKVFPRAVEFAGYDPIREDFSGSNYLAVHREHEDLIARLAGATRTAGHAVNPPPARPAVAPSGKPAETD